MPITAYNAEAACQNVRDMIRSNESMDRDSMLKKIETAFSTSDVDELMSLLSSTWFGVPESTCCWSIPGFKEAVDLMEDPPEED